MSDSELSSAAGSEPSSPAAAPAQPASPENKPTGNRYDAMFGSDNGSDAGANDEDEDDDVGTRKRARKEGGGDEDGDNEDAGDDDLFGDGGDDDGERRELDDKDLSPTPEGHSPRPPSPDQFIEVTLPRHPGPANGDDGHLYLLKIPSFLSVEPVLFNPQTFVLPTLPTDSSISPYTAATTTIRARQDPKDPTQLQSNTRIIRWSDGSLSLQVASSPNLYDLPAKALCPDPNNEDREYDPAQDSHTYLMDPHESASALRVVGRATKALKAVSASASLVADQSIQRLTTEFQAAMADRTGRRNQLGIKDLKDPEAERKEAERIAKEKERAAKKIEAQQRRQREREPLGMDSARRAYNRVTGTRSKRDSPPITSGRRGREDEYDLEDEFIEGSEEEEEVATDDSEEEEEEEEEDRAGRRKGGDRKRRRVVDDDDSE